MSEVVTIKLGGFMGKKYAKTVKLAGENWFQIMSGLEHRFGPEFVEDVRKNDWHLYDGEKKKGNDLSNEQVEQNPPLKNKLVHLIPVIKGESSAIQMVLGAILIVVGFFTSWMGIGVGLMAAGAGLMVGGAVGMLMAPKTGGPDHGDDKGATVFNGAVNITSQGGPIPLVYGRHRRVSSVVISTDFSSDRTG